jgi:hypothetical protein
MSDPLPKSLERFGEDLERAIERDLDRRRARVSALRRLGNRWRRHIVAPAIAAVALGCAAATIVVYVALRGPTAAYALRLSHDGSLTLTIRDLTRAAPELNARFRAMGIDQRVVPIRRGCQQRRLVNYPNQPPTQAITFIPTATPAPSSPRGAAAADRVDVLAAARQANGRVSLTLLEVRRPAPRCFGTAISTTHDAMSAKAPRVVPRLQIPSSS